MQHAAKFRRNPIVGEAQDNNWPLPKFYFSVDIADVGENLAFQEVSSLDAEDDVIEYRAGNSKAFSTIKMPGLRQSGNVALKKGIFPNDYIFWTWINQIKMNTITRQTVTVKLLDESGNATMVWTLANAFPTKVSGTNLSSDGNQTSIESLEIAHEGLTIENS